MRAKRSIARQVRASNNINALVCGLPSSAPTWAPSPEPGEEMDGPVTFQADRCKTARALPAVSTSHMIQSKHHGDKRHGHLRGRSSAASARSCVGGREALAAPLQQDFRHTRSFQTSWTWELPPGGCGEPRDRLLRTAHPTCIPLLPVKTPSRSTPIATEHPQNSVIP